MVLLLFSYYKETFLEQWIHNKYEEHGIIHITDYSIENIAAAFDVNLVFGNFPPFSDNEDRVIFLNKHSDPVLTRAIFFHELCHVLRHAGDQRVMPELFKDAQEAEAEQFVLYAAIPFYMFAKMEVPDQRCEAIPYLAEHFQVSMKVAEDRLDQIQRRILHGSLLAAAREAHQENKTKQQPNWTPETTRILDQLNQQLVKRGQSHAHRRVL